MSIAQQTAKHFRDVHFGGNWTCVNLKDTLNGITWQQASTKVHSFNTIATLLFHMNYYTNIQLRVLKGGPVEGNDKLSFEHPPITSEQDWNNLLNKVWADTEELASLMEQMPESRFWDIFSEEKYGNYYRNLHGAIEHTHYHLGQIVLIKKILQEEGTTVVVDTKDATQHASA